MGSNASRLVLRGATALFCAVATYSCSLLVSTSDLTSPSDANAPSTMTDVVDVATGPRPASDVNAPETDAPPTTPCATALLCDSFERMNVSDGWTGLTTSQGTTVSITSGALRVTLPSFDAGSSASAYLYRSFDGGVSQSVTMRSLVRFVTQPAMGGMHLGQLAFLEGGGALTLVFPFFIGPQMGVAELHCNGPCDYRQTAFPAPEIAPGIAHEIELRVDFTKSPAVLGLVVDGQTVASKPTETGLVAGRPLEVRVGIPALDGPTEGREVLIDDVIVTGN